MMGKMHIAKQILFADVQEASSAENQKTKEEYKDFETSRTKNQKLLAEVQQAIVCCVSSPRNKIRLKQRC